MSGIVAADSAPRHSTRRRQSTKTRTRGNTKGGVSFRCRHAVSLPGPHLVVTVDVHSNPPPDVVALVVGRRIAEQILVRQLVEQIAEGAVQLVDAVGEERAPAGGGRDSIHDAFERV